MAEEGNAHAGEKRINAVIINAVRINAVRINAVRINARIKKHGNIVKGYKYLFIALLPGFL